MTDRGRRLVRAGREVDRIREHRCTLVWSRMGGRIREPSGGPRLRRAAGRDRQQGFPTAAPPRTTRPPSDYTSGTTATRKGSCSPTAMSRPRPGDHRRARLDRRRHLGARGAHVPPRRRMGHLGRHLGRRPPRHGRALSIPARCSETLGRGEVTVTNLIPTMLNDLVNHPASGRYPFTGVPPGDERWCADLTAARAAE